MVVLDCQCHQHVLIDSITTSQDMILMITCLILVLSKSIYCFYKIYDSSVSRLELYLMNCLHLFIFYIFNNSLLCLDMSVAKIQDTNTFLKVPIQSLSISSIMLNSLSYIILKNLEECMFSIIDYSEYKILLLDFLFI